MKKEVQLTYNKPGFFLNPKIVSCLMCERVKQLEGTEVAPFSGVGSDWLLDQIINADSLKLPCIGWISGMIFFLLY